MGRVEGKVAISTGAASGLGEADARLLAAEGASVVMTDINTAAGEVIAGEIGAEFVQQDVSEEATWPMLVERVMDRHGRLNILVNNAAVLYNGTAPELADAEWDEMFAVNVSALFRTSRAALRHMLAAKSGVIVNLASESGLNGEPALGAYCATEGAVIQLTKSMALDHIRDGVRINALCPGETHTQMMDDILKQKGGDFDESLKDFARGIPMGRIADPAEVARCVLFLASEDASYVTGVNFPVDGGNDATGGVYP